MPGKNYRDKVVGRTALLVPRGKAETKLRKCIDEGKEIRLSQQDFSCYSIQAEVTLVDYIKRKTYSRVIVTIQVQSTW